jgi:DNA invertase Pin-like site-specific DNA recombinase
MYGGNGATDEVVCRKMDRFARSLTDLLEITSKIDGSGAEFISLTEKLDTSSADPYSAIASSMISLFRIIICTCMVLS